MFAKNKPNMMKIIKLIGLILPFLITGNMQARELPEMGSQSDTLAFVAGYYSIDLLLAKDYDYSSINKATLLEGATTAFAHQREKLSQEDVRAKLKEKAKNEIKAGEQQTFNLGYIVGAMIIDMAGAEDLDERLAKEGIVYRLEGANLSENIANNVKFGYEKVKAALKGQVTP